MTLRTKREPSGRSGFRNPWAQEPGFIDYDGDGWIDILLAGGGGWEQSTLVHDRPIWLYKNNGDGTFVLQTKEAGLGAVDAYSIGFGVADYDK